MRNSCAVAMRNAILQNYLNIKFNVNFKDTLRVQHILWLLHQLQAILVIIHIVLLVDITNDRCGCYKIQLDFFLPLPIISMSMNSLVRIWGVHSPS